jgi:hypothetical protein
MIRSQDSAVGIVNGFRVGGRGVGVPSPGIGENFSLLQNVQTSSGAHRASYPMGTGGSSSREVKWLRNENDCSPPTSAEFKNTWIYTSTPPYAFMA